MSKFDNAFSDLAHTGSSDESSSGFSKEARLEQNTKIVELFGTQDKAKARVGIVSGIIDLGIQEMPDGEQVFSGNKEQEAEAIEKDPTNYFKDGFDPKTKAPARLKCWKVKPQRCVAITVDFPQFQFDYGGEIGVKPIRFLLNGSFTPKGKKPWEAILGRLYSLKETTADFAPNWSLPANSILHKLAVGTGVIPAKEPFTKAMLGKLIGKPALFEVQLYLKEGHLNERILFKSEVPEGMVSPEWNEDDGYYVRIDGANEASTIKQLRKNVKNTILRSSSYPDSQLQIQHGSLLEDSFKPKAEAPTEVTKEEVTETKVSNSDAAPWDSSEEETFPSFD